MKASVDWFSAVHRKYKANLGTSKFVHLTKYTAEVYQIGSGSPIILIPGLAGGYELLGPLAKSLSNHHHVHSYQLRGENDSFAVRHPFELDDLVEDLAELIEALRLENPTIMGVSFGAIIALKFAIRYPHRLHRLIVHGVGAAVRAQPYSASREHGPVALPLAHRQSFRQSIFQPAFWRQAEKGFLV